MVIFALATMGRRDWRAEWKQWDQLESCSHPLFALNFPGFLLRVVVASLTFCAPVPGKYLDNSERLMIPAMCQALPGDPTQREQIWTPAATWINPEESMLSEMSQPRNDKCCVIPLRFLE